MYQLPDLFTFLPGITYSVFTNEGNWMFESCQILLAKFHFSTEKLLLFSHFSMYIHITYINGFPRTWRFC